MIRSHLLKVDKLSVDLLGLVVGLNFEVSDLSYEVVDEFAESAFEEGILLRLLVFQVLRLRPLSTLPARRLSQG